jgi:hypothetical protein
MAEITEQIVREAPEIEAYKLGLLESAKKLADQPITLPTYQVAGMSGLQQQAIQQASPATGGIGGYQPYLQQAGYTMAPASGYITTGAEAITPEGIASYMNPYQQAIQDEIMRAYNIQSQQAAGQAVGAGAFGGGRAAIQQAEVGRNLAQALAASQAQNFIQAQQAAEREQARKMQAGQQLGQLGLQQAALGETAQKQALTDLQTQFDIGKQMQAQDQATLEAQRQSELAQLYEPYQRYGFLSDIYKGAPTTQQTLATATSPSVSPAQQFLGLGIAGLSAAAGAQKAGLFG